MPISVLFVGDLETMVVHRDPNCPSRYTYPAQAGLARTFMTAKEAMEHGFSLCICAEAERPPKTVRAA